MVELVKYLNYPWKLTARFNRYSPNTLWSTGYCKTPQRLMVSLGKHGLLCLLDNWVWTNADELQVAL
jgi:hypothetical protein